MAFSGRMRFFALFPLPLWQLFIEQNAGTAGVEKHGLPTRLVLQEGADLVVGAYFHAILGQGLPERGRHFLLADKPVSMALPYEQVADADGVEIDIGAADVERPGDIVQGGSQVEGLPAHALADGGQLFGAALPGVFQA
jgi:hypothetical protein